MKLYVLVREDLTTSYQAVQAGHAVAEFLLRGPVTEWDNGTLIYLGVPTERELVAWGERLSLKGLKWEGFREPDINNEMTALACVADGKVFSNLRLLKKS